MIAIQELRALLDSAEAIRTECAGLCPAPLPIARTGVQPALVRPSDDWLLPPAITSGALCSTRPRILAAMHSAIERFRTFLWKSMNRTLSATVSLGSREDGVVERRVVTLMEAAYKRHILSVKLIVERALQATQSGTCQTSRKAGGFTEVSCQSSGCCWY